MRCTLFAVAARKGSSRANAAASKMPCATCSPEKLLYASLLTWMRKDDCADPSHLVVRARKA